METALVVEHEDEEAAACDCCTGVGRELVHGVCAPCMSDCRGDQGCDHILRALAENYSRHRRVHDCCNYRFSTCSVAAELQLKLRREEAR